MTERRDLNVSGNKVINLKWPTKFNDAATKGYVDNVHLLKPSDNIHEYIRYINNRNDLLHSIAGLVRVKSDMEYHHKKITKEKIGILGLNRLHQYWSIV